jgi:murein DD-endopeptidase MepM/ murein hydrolase activator NlpD
MKGNSTIHTFRYFIGKKNASRISRLPVVLLLAGGVLFGVTRLVGYKQQTAAALLNSMAPEIIRWGISLHTHSCEEKLLKSGDVLGEILIARGLDYPQVNTLVENAKPVFNLSALRAGKILYFLTPRGGLVPTRMVYEPSPYEYILFDLRPPFTSKLVKRAMETKIVAASGVLESSFWQALTDNGLSDELADGMIDVLASSVDFYHQRRGDRFKVVFEQHIVEGNPVGTGKIIAALYEREGKLSYAFRYQIPGEKNDYFDFEGRPARKAFLKSPVKFSRISSRYNLNRKHPVLGYRKAHRGTDYAAPYGTPIMAVAEGVVVEAGRRGGNGNFVKIKHDGSYQTQYLHMQGFARGMRPGVRVAQGQTIGFVGSTGLATGPHVCFRFWKNGVEVDHLRLQLPQPQPISADKMKSYIPVRDNLIKLLESVNYRTFNRAEQEELHDVDSLLVPNV